MENKYIDAEDLRKLIKGLTINQSRKYISELQKEMIKRNLWIPKTKKKLALLSIAKDKFGI